MNYLKGVYWDLDGTIANTELEAHLPAFNAAFEDFNLNWTWDKLTYINLLKINGGKNRIIYYSKVKNYKLPNYLAGDIHKRKQYYYFKNIEKNTVTLKTGVKRLVSELYLKNVKQFIVTSSSKKQVELLLDYLFKDFKPFEFIISSDDVEFHKPNPLPYLKAINLSGLKKNESIVIEDSNSGIKSSLAAGLPTIYIPSNIPTVIDKKINLDCIIDTLGDGIKMSKIRKGPKLEGNYIDFAFLNKFLMVTNHAKD